MWMSRTSAEMSILGRSEKNNQQIRALQFELESAKERISERKGAYMLVSPSSLSNGFECGF